MPYTTTTRRLGPYVYPRIALAGALAGAGNYLTAAGIAAVLGHHGFPPEVVPVGMVLTGAGLILAALTAKGTRPRITRRWEP